MPKTSTQLSAILRGIQGFAGFVRIGVYQGPDATQLDQDWRYHDGDTFSDMLWDAGEPEENGAMMELHTEDCAIVRRVLPGVHDFYCSSDQAYLCEAL